MRNVLCLAVIFFLVGGTVSQYLPPRIVEPENKKTVHVLPDKDTAMQCQANGVPQPSYRWQKDGTEVKSDGITQVDPITGWLRITGITRLQEGEYQCLAHNNIRGKEVVAMSSVISVKQVYLDTNWNEPVQTLEREQGQYARLTCDNPPPSVPKGAFQWQISAGNANEGTITTDTRKYMDSQGTLHFVYLEMTDDKSSTKKQYKCGVLNRISDVIKLGSAKNLRVTPKGSVPQAEPRNQFFTTNAEFMRGSDAELECVFSGFPIPEISWLDKKGDQIIPGIKYELVSPQKLKVKSVQEEVDEGKYTCVGSSNTGKDRAFIDLKVISGPIWVESLSSRTIPEGRDARFPCRARPTNKGAPLRQPVWYQNGQPMSTHNTTKFAFSSDFKVLIVKNLTKPEDIACFQCNVSNEVGYEFRDGCLNVIKPITIVQQPPPTQTVSKGGRVDLTVVGQTDPGYTLDYAWRFKGKSYDDQHNQLPFIVFDMITKSAFINTSGLSDEEYKSINGTYYRDLFHEFDNFTVVINVKLTELPQSETLVEAGMDLWWVALVVAVIVLVVFIIIFVKVCQNKNKEGTYQLDKKERACKLNPEKDLAENDFHDLSRALGDEDDPKSKPSVNHTFDFENETDDDEDDKSLMQYGKDH